MGEVVSLAKHREEQSPHGAGDVLCPACKHEWVGVAPVGTAFHTCPACGSHTARWKRPFASGVGDLYYSCNHCSSEHLYFIKRGSTLEAKCSGCGFDHTGQIL
jgi:ribosomal protein L37AE/L43A